MSVFQQRIKSMPLKARTNVVLIEKVNITTKLRYGTDLEFLYREFKISLVNRALTEKVDNMQDQMNCASREMKILRIKRKC